MVYLNVFLKILKSLFLHTPLMNVKKPRKIFLDAVTREIFALSVTYIFVLLLGINCIAFFSVEMYTFSVISIIIAVSLPIFIRFIYRLGVARGRADMFFVDDE